MPETGPPEQCDIQAPFKADQGLASEETSDGQVPVGIHENTEVIGSKANSVNNNDVEERDAREIITSECDMETSEEGAGDSVVDKTLDVEDKVTEGGWDWLIVFSCFTQYLISNSYRLCFGIIYVELLEEFNESSSTTAWIFSFIEATYLGAGLLGSPLLKLFGARVVFISGNILLASGIVASSFVRTVWVLYITFGVISGIGAGLLDFTSIVLPCHYFIKRRALATALTVTGSGVGTLVMAPIMTLLMEEYGWRGSCFLLAAIVLQLMVFTVYIWPPRQMPKDTKQLSQDVEEVQTEKSSYENEGFELDEATDRHAVTADGMGTHQSESQTDNAEVKRSQVKVILQQMFDVQVLKNGRACGAIVLVAFSTLGVSTSYLFMPDQALWHGLTKTQAGLVVSVSGIASLAGRVVVGLTFDLRHVKRVRAYLLPLSAIACGLAMLISYNSLLEGQIAYAMTFGLFFGLTVAGLTPVLADIIGAERMGSSIAMAYTLSVAFLLLGPTLGGWLYDKFGNYYAVFAVCAGAHVVAGMAFLLPQIYSSIKARS